MFSVKICSMTNIKLRSGVGLVALALSFQSMARGVSFKGIPISKSVTQSNSLKTERGNRIVNYWLERDLGAFSRSSNIAFGMPALARVMRGEKMDEVNAVFSDPKTVPYAKYGTNINIYGLCKRNGDYDFMLQNLIRIIYTDRKTNNLSEVSKYRLLHHLLTAKGNEHYETFWLGICGKHKDTENHILMTEGSRYLTNQLLMEDLKDRWTEDELAIYDNEKNGFNDWLTEHLQIYLREHFDEYNSRPYQGYTVLAVNNIHSYAWNPRVKLAAELVLDYLSAFYVFQSIGGKRNVPFRRQPKYEPISRTYVGDGETARFSYLVGNYDYLKSTETPFVLPYGAHFMLGAVASEYKVPFEIQHLFFNRVKYYQRVMHQAPEIYSSSEGYLINAGGAYLNRFDMATKENDGWARPTALIPLGESSSNYNDWLHFKGHKKRLRKRNTCVYDNFACGNNVHVPESFKNCAETVGRFTFYNLTKENCGLDYDLSVALYREKCDTIICRMRGKDFGFFEVSEQSKMSHAEFKLNVLKNNKARFSSRKVSRYVTTEGLKIDFQVLPFSRKYWEIVKVDGIGQERKFKNWPLAQGDILNADGEGMVTFDNPALNKRIILDFKDGKNPKREVIDL